MAQTARKQKISRMTYRSQPCARCKGSTKRGLTQFHPLVGYGVYTGLVVVWILIIGSVLDGSLVLSHGQQINLPLGLGVFPALMFFTLWWIRLSYRGWYPSPPTSPVVRLLSGPDVGKVVALHEGRVACPHGYVMTLLCFSCRRCLGQANFEAQQDNAPLPPDWYSVDGDKAMYTPPAGATLPGTAGLVVYGRLAAACRGLAAVGNDPAAGGIVEDLSKIVTPLLHQEEHDASFDAAAESLCQQAIAAVLTSSKVASCRTIAQTVADETRALTPAERAQITPVVDLLTQIRADNLLIADVGTPGPSDGSPGARNAVKIDQILQELHAALAAVDPPPPPPVKQSSSRDLLGELAITAVGLEILEGRDPF